MDITELGKILETIMLICFGFSWPINAIKNIKARSAKGMSLPFILLIVCGYIAGIAAKIVTGKYHLFIDGIFNYVFVVYVLNIILVSVNIPVYFINKGYDKKAEQNK